MDYIDLRSDTVTLPTEGMRRAMYQAQVGDDVYEDDPTVKKLEAYAAKLMDKESALFVPTGTFGNQLALFTHCQRGDEVILGEDCHIMQHEVGAASVIAGVQLRTVSELKGIMDPRKIVSKIRLEELHHPSTGLIAMENARSNGRVMTLSEMDEIFQLSREYKIPVHLDGARIFNAAIYLKTEVSKIAGFADSVMFCLSKGLCAPVGSLLVGSEEFVTKARKKRKLMGGGMRQVGFLAAAGLIALREMPAKLETDHENAQVLGAELAKIPSVKIDLADIQINMVWLKIAAEYDGRALYQELLQKGIKVNCPESGIMRLMTHHGVQRSDIFQVTAAINDYFAHH